MKKIIEMKQERAALIKKMRDMLDLADTENRSMTAEENQAYDRMDKEVDELEVKIGREERMQGLSQGLDLGGDNGEEKDNPAIGDPGTRSNDNEDPFDTQEYRDAFMGFMRGDLRPNEVRALNETIDADKGAVLVPTSFEKKLIDTLKAEVFMRGICQVDASSSNKTIPMVTGKGAAGWIDELGNYPESDDTFGSMDMGAYKAGRIVKISEELLQDSVFNLENYLRRSLADSLAELEETAFISGDGTKKPTGFLQTAQIGITAAATNAITADEIIDLFYSLKRKYRGKATWLWNDAASKLLRKLKDSQGQYIWQPSIRAGEPNVMLNRPVIAGVAMPDVAASAKPIGFGDFKNYQVLDRRGIYIQRLNELYAGAGQVGFRAYKRVDGKLLLPESVKVLEMKAL